MIGELYLQDAAALARIEAKMDGIEAKMDGIVMMQNNLCAVSPVTFSAAASQTRGTDWHFKVVSYYNHKKCMVLSQLYPNQAVPSWFESYHEHGSPQDCISSSCGAHHSEGAGYSWQIMEYGHMARVQWPTSITSS